MASKKAKVSHPPRTHRVSLSLDCSDVPLPLPHRSDYPAYQAPPRAQCTSTAHSLPDHHLSLSPLCLPLYSPG